MIGSIVAMSGAEVFTFACGFFSDVVACISLGFWIAWHEK